MLKVFDFLGKGAKRGLKGQKRAKAAEGDF
jgi:hypothetical protein